MQPKPSFLFLNLFVENVFFRSLHLDTEFKKLDFKSFLKFYSGKNSWGFHLLFILPVSLIFLRKDKMFSKAWYKTVNTFYRYVPIQHSVDDFFQYYLTHKEIFWWFQEKGKMISVLLFQGSFPLAHKGYASSKMLSISYGENWSLTCNQPLWFRNTIFQKQPYGRREGWKDRRKEEKSYVLARKEKMYFQCV